MNDNTAMTLTVVAVAAALTLSALSLRSCAVELNQSNNNAIVDCVGSTNDPLACAKAISGR